MYSRMFEGKKIKITNYHYKKLLGRFDSNNFKYEETFGSSRFRKMINRSPCSLCKAYSQRRRRVPNCGKCPLRQFETNNSGFGHFLGCSYILKQLAPTKYIDISIGYVLYRCIDKRMALKELKVITDFLKSFEKE